LAPALRAKESEEYDGDDNGEEEEEQHVQGKDAHRKGAYANATNLREWVGGGEERRSLARKKEKKKEKRN
jgi:hypothetical protein